MSMDFVGSPNFSDRSLPRHSANGPRRSRAGSRASSLDHRLSIIAEDANAPPPVPAPSQTHARPFRNKFLGDPPRYSNGSRPPQYSLWDVTGPKGEKFQDLRDNAYVARRGGWKRICLIAFIIIACIIALVVGLAVGLHKKSSSSSSAASPSTSPSTTSSPSSTGPFPAGSWTFTTFLDSTSTNCTSNPLAWKCEPSVTYANSPTNSEATFNWIINSTSPSTFTISSTDNPFAINFTNASLSLLDANTPTERYSFTTTVQKRVFPSFSVQCFYNTTQFSADLYTKRAKSYPSNSSSTSTSSPAAAATSGATGAAAGGVFADWNFAVDATQSIGGGEDVPACFNMDNGIVGSRVTSGYTVEPAADFCSCAYKNYDP